MSNTLIPTENLNMKVTADHLVWESDFFKAVYSWEAILVEASKRLFGELSYDYIMEQLTVRSADEKIIGDAGEDSSALVEFHCPLECFNGDTYFIRSAKAHSHGEISIDFSMNNNDYTHSVTVTQTDLCRMISRFNITPEGVKVISQGKSGLMNI